MNVSDFFYLKIDAIENKAEFKMQHLWSRKAENVCIVCTGGINNNGKIKKINWKINWTKYFILK